MKQFGLVAMGRNEGSRLRQCLMEAIGQVAWVVYVDSGSTDGSLKLSRSIGADKLELDLQHFASKPATISSSLNRLKKQTTMIQPIESIFISNKINSHSNTFIKSIPGTSFSRTKNLF
ncbi:hypothetical protein QUB56_03245 [Microcoleus sp. AR_TQ3_B6]|uniref:hypothetical protein n=1 Tax=Microcoleus sp. AR_TQ3_B6 TaxID=3055284 RepID=UPI002FD406C2